MITPRHNAARRCVLGNSHQTWVGGIMLTAKKVTEKKAPYMFEQQYGGALANLAKTPQPIEGIEMAVRRPLEQVDYGETRPLTLFGASISERASETATSA
jgi:hypothetical protein